MASLPFSWDGEITAFIPKFPACGRVLESRCSVAANQAPGRTPESASILNPRVRFQSLSAPFVARTLRLCEALAFSLEM